MKNFMYLFFMVLIVSACSTTKTPDHGWKDKKWILQELKGVPVQTSGTDKDAHLVFSASDSRFSGTGGCNRIMGAYTITKKGKLTFSNPAGTLMSCPDLAFEESFLKTLATVDHYAVVEQALLLKKGNEVVMKLK